MAGEKVSASRLAMYMKGINFPADKQMLVNKAKSNGAPDNVMEFMNRLPEKQYNRANEVEQEFGNMQ